MSAIDLARVRRAMKANSWDISNQVLYDLCDAHPKHSDKGVVVAKILLIGRVYAAAIERRRSKMEDESTDAFYLDTVAPTLMQAGIDGWITEARSCRPGTPSALRTLVRIHGDTTALFRQISGLEKRSLASKYLHFHVPKLFYIYDSRAVEAIREFSADLPRTSGSAGLGDSEYRKFAEKCEGLRALCARRFSLNLSPRQIDNLLLRFNER